MQREGRTRWIAAGTMIALMMAFAMTAAAAPRRAKRTMPWDYRRLRRAPKIHPTKESTPRGMRSFFYEGAELNGKPTWVFAYYAAPKGKPPEGGWPAVVCVHGGDGTAYPEWIRKWNRQKYAAIAMDLEGRTPSGKTHKNAGPARKDWFGDRDLPDKQQWFYHAVADVIRAHSLLRSFPEISKRKIGLTGISWGGVVASTVAGVDSRLAFVIPVFGGGFIHESDNPDLAQWFPPKNMSAAQYRNYRSKWDPSAHLPYARMPMLWVSSYNDPVFQINIFAKSAQAARGPSTLCIRPSMRHGHGSGWDAGGRAMDIYTFADSIVKEGRPFPDLEEPTVDPEDSKVHVGYRGELKRAHVRFTTSDGRWKDRRWGEIGCTIRKDEVIASKQLPAGTTAYYVNAWDQMNNLVSSQLMLTDSEAKQ